MNSPKKKKKKKMLAIPVEHILAKRIFFDNFAWTRHLGPHFSVTKFLAIFESRFWGCSEVDNTKRDMPSSKSASLLPEYAIKNVFTRLLRNLKKIIGGSMWIFSKNRKNAVNWGLCRECFGIVNKCTHINGFKLIFDIFTANNLLQGFVWVLNLASTFFRGAVRIYQQLN